MPTGNIEIQEYIQEEGKEMNRSRGELKIEAILNQYNFDYDIEYSFDDLLADGSNIPLRFDFVVYDDEGEIDFLIEYQGEQHYKAFPRFGGIKGLKRQQHNDLKKKRYCSMHDIPLVVVPYWDYNILNLDYLLPYEGYR